MIEKKRHFKKEAERAVLVGVIYGEQTDVQMQDYLDELEFLAETAGAETIKRFVQKLPHPDNRYFVGSGKMREIKEYVKLKDISLVIFDDELSGKQINNLEEELKIKILDRSGLILDIFAGRAKTAQAKAQVELAQMQYLLPRLRGMWTHLERQRGGIGMRGPGEKEIETDRRIIKDKISKLKKDLEKINVQDETRRKSRGELIRVSLVGYTNVGKSTLMNAVAKADVFAENKLFATLDTTVKKIVWEQMPFLLSDTVGFIRKLPHHLVESFKSTLDEVRESDILIHVVDFAHSDFEDHIEVVRHTLKDLKAGDKPTLMVFNKMDKFRAEQIDDFLTPEVQKEAYEERIAPFVKEFGKNIVFMSAQERENIDEFRAKVLHLVAEQYKIRYPYKEFYY